MGILSPPVVYRIGPFTLDMRSGDLMRNGQPVRMQEKPRSLLMVFVNRPGELITRSELHRELWPEDNFGDFEDGLNVAMSKLREALGDDIQAPRYIETVRGRGYRLLARVDALVPRPSEIPGEAAAPVSAESANTAASAGVDIALAPADSLAPAPNRVRFHVRLRWLVSGFTLACALSGMWYWLTQGRPVLPFNSHDSILIADFDNQTGNPRFDNALGLALSVSLEQSRSVNIYSRLQTYNVLRRMERNQDARITPSLAREICQRENIPVLVTPGITRTGNEYLIVAQLIDPASGATIRSYSERTHSEDQILAELDSVAAAIRHDLGESRIEIHRSSRPLPEVTTASLAALQQYADGRAMAGRGRTMAAVEHYQAAIAADPGFAMAHASLGYLDYSFLLHSPEQGEQEFRTALSLASRTTDRERAYIELSYAESQGRISDAMVLYKSYLQQYPDDLGVLGNYARLLRMHGHVAESVPIYQQIARRWPTHASNFVELATAYSQLGQLPQSLQAYEQAFSLDPHILNTGNVSREYGFTLVRNGQENKAEEVFSALLADPGSYANGERSLAFLDLYRGLYTSARRHLTQALSKSSDAFSRARIHFMLAIVAAGEGDEAEQIAQLDRIAAVLPEIGPKIEYGSLLGQAYARAGKVDKARKILAIIAPMVNERIEDQVAYTQLLRAEISEAAGDPLTALAFLKPPASDDSDSPAVLTRESLAHIYQRLGRVDEAIDWYRQFAFTAGSDSLGWEPQQQVFEAWYTLAVDYKQKGDRTQAMAALDPLLDHWRNADGNLPLLKSARELRRQLIAAH